MKNSSLTQRCILSVLILFIVIPSTWAQSLESLKSGDRRQAYLEQILDWLPPDRPGFGRVSYLDTTFEDWLERTKELPPDFSQMPSIPDLPHPLILDEGRSNIPVETPEQWKEKKAWMEEQLQHYVSGTFPPAPENIEAKILSEKMDGDVKLQRVELSFGPGHEAKLNLELMIPPGEGPFPVFMTQWTHRGWAQIAVRRGYIACLYAGADSLDDTEDYGRIWAGQYDFTRLMRRAWGSYRAIDYLYTLPTVDRAKIALTGHSRNGKTSLMAAAFDERIAAVIPSSGGTGAEVPWRYTAYRYDVEDISLLGPAQPSWLHPRLRFFVGREDKLPTDQNHFMALIAPRGLMLSTATEEGASNPWGIEQAYHSAKEAYKHLSADDQIALRYRNGLHGTNAEDIEAYVDFFDYVFGRTSKKPIKKWDYVSSFEQWKDDSGEKIHIADFPERNNPSGITDNKDQKITNSKQWIEFRKDLKEQVQWILGERPPGVSNSGPGHVKNGGAGEEKFGNVISRPAATSDMARMSVSPYSGFGDYLYGYLYFPRDKKDRKDKMPVVVYLHEYDYSKGFSSMSFEHNMGSYFAELVKRGYAVFAYDMIGFGSRQEEGLHFYDRYPHWSRMGKMVADVSGAVDALAKMDQIDPDQILVSGYSLGATVGLYAAALDDRIAGLISVAGFTPMRAMDTKNGESAAKNTTHLRNLSSSHLLIPRLGFFMDQPRRVPVDYDELLAMVAPRSMLVIAPEYDQEADAQAVLESVDQAKEVYKMMNASQKMEVFSPPDYNRFSYEMREKVYEWLEKEVD